MTTLVQNILSKRLEYPAMARQVNSETSISFFDITNDKKSTTSRNMFLTN